MNFSKNRGVKVLGLLGGVFLVFLGITSAQNGVEDSVEKLVQIPDAVVEDIVKEEDGLFTVTSVIDGDTFKIQMGNSEDTVRVIGIDTPETKYSSAGEECYGPEASAEAQSILSGTSVLLTSDQTQDFRDTYGRLLAYVTLEDGRDYGEVMLEGGFAEEFTFIAPYVKQSEYRQVAARAQEQERGLWSCSE